jgi:periplasmic protein CpxP/Spy
MKKIIKSRKVQVSLTVILFVMINLMSLSLAAQQGKNGGGYGGATPEERAKRQTDMMKESLSLTAVQEPKISAINLKYAKKMEDVRKVADTAARRKSVQNLNKQKEGELKAILTADQFKSYLKQVEEMKARRREMQH